MQRKKAIIIGSGVSGLAAAIRLSVNNFDVEVFESNDYPGGKLSVFEKISRKLFFFTTSSAIFLF